MKPSKSMNPVKAWAIMVSTKAPEEQYQFHGISNLDVDGGNDGLQIFSKKKVALSHRFYDEKVVPILITFPKK